MAQNNRRWNRGQNQDKTKKKMTHALKILSIKKEHTYVRLHCKYRHHTVHEPLPPNSQVHTTKIRCSEAPLIIVISCHFTSYIEHTYIQFTIPQSNSRDYNFSHVILL